jgi:hypothetical protein
MKRRTWVAFVWLVGCAQGGGKFQDAGRADSGADTGPPPCGGGGMSCCAKSVCNDGLKCDAFNTCVRPMSDAGEAGGGCLSVECAGVCTHLESDPKNCGVCGHDCQGNFCSLGTCLATGIVVGASPVQLAVDTMNVYFTDANGTVSSAPSGGGTLERLVAGVASPYGLALASTSIYFTSQGTLSGGFTDGAVLKIPYGGVGDGGAPTPIATGRTKPASLVVDDASVYWLEPGASTEDGSVLSCPLAGCPANTPTVITDNLALPYGIAIDETNVYVTTSAGGQVIAFSKSTGKDTVLIDMQNEPAGITVQNGTVYWATMGDGLVQAIATTGGEPAGIAETEGSPQAVAADAVNVYWSDTAPTGTFGPLDSCVVGGCPPANPMALVSVEQTATDIAIDALFVYWIGTDGQILRVAK